MTKLPEDDCRRRFTELQNILAHKNKQLDALGHVWCSGGCEGGAARYENPDTITEETVQLVEKNTLRLRTWWENRKAKAASRKL